MANMKAKIKVNKDLGPYTKGQVVTVELDNDGVPTSTYWRRRLTDAKHDGCCELVQPRQKTKEKDNTRGGNDA